MGRDESEIMRPPAVPVQDALTTLLPRIENWRARCLNRKFDNSSLEEDALTLLGDIEAALHREPLAVRKSEEAK